MKERRREKTEGPDTRGKSTDMSISRTQTRRNTTHIHIKLKTQIINNANTTEENGLMMTKEQIKNLWGKS